MRFAKIFFAVLVLTSIVFADSDEAFPAWTYYGEIVEHVGILAVALVGFILMLPHRNKSGMDFVLTGLALLAISQLLVNMHHFLILYAGIYTALVHHGLLLVSVVFLIFGIYKFSSAKK